VNNVRRRILIVEDDRFVGSLLAEALKGQGFDTCLVESALAAKKAVESFDPDAAVIDVVLGEGPSGIDLVQVLARERPDIASILLTRHPDFQDSGFAASQIPPGVAYLRKSMISDTESLVQAIDEALRGRGADIRHDKIEKSSLDVLTRNQREVLRLIAQGYSNGEIARRRGISTSAVEQNVAAIFRAFDLDTRDAVIPRVEAVRRYIEAVGVPERTAT
jgi:DNA-binding NarL/FixJ family response regulator